MVTGSRPLQGHGQAYQVRWRHRPRRSPADTRGLRDRHLCRRGDALARADRRQDGSPRASLRQGQGTTQRARALQAHGRHSPRTPLRHGRKAQHGHGQADARERRRASRRPQERSYRATGWRVEHQPGRAQPIPHRPHGAVHSRVVTHGQVRSVVATLSHRGDLHQRGDLPLARLHHQDRHQGQRPLRGQQRPQLHQAPH